MKLLNYISTLLALLLTLFATELTAQHQFLGGDITYGHHNGNSYEVYVRLYTDCAGGNPPGNIQLDVNAPSVGFNNSFTITLTASSQIDPLCSSYGNNSACNGGTLFGALENIYKAVLPLPANANDITLSVSRCCRNAANTNLLNAAISNLYFESKMSTAGTIAGNSSPRFFNQPTLFMAPGQNRNLDFAAYDPDGDSLAYELVQTKKSAAQFMQYAIGYSATQPIASNLATVLDPLTGLLNCTPIVDQLSAISVLVKEYRNGIQIGSVLRNVELNVSSNAPGNTLPKLGTINGGSAYFITACSNDTLQFLIESIDPEPNQQLSIDVLQTPPGMSLAISSLSLRPHIKATWAPDSTLVSNTPYILYFLVRDNNCPANGYQMYAYKVFVAECSEDVLPGDANKDNVANMYDLLPIGLGFNTVGPTRNQPSLNWIPQTSLNWGQTFAWGTDYKHADCDGNGIINADDATAILHNYNPLYQSRSAIRSNPGGPVLTMTPVYDTVLAGTQVTIPVTLGSANNTAVDVYGLVFSVSYNGDLIEPGSISVTFPNNTWVASSDPTISIWKDFSLFKRLDLGVTRVDRTSRNGWGEICLVSFVMQDDITGKDLHTIVEFEFTDVWMVDHRGMELPVTPQTAYLVLKQAGTEDPVSGLNGLDADKITVYPNPARDVLNINSPYNLSSVVLHNTVGSVVKEIIFSGNPQQTINIADLANGVYLLAIQDQQGNLTYKRFLKKSSE